MEKKINTTDAVDILHRRYIKGDPDRKASLEAERVNAEVSRLIYELRKDAGLSQKELAELIGTTQSVISRLEDADYEGHSLSVLNRIAKALNQRLTVLMMEDDHEVDTIRIAFQELMQKLRRRKGLTVDQLAKKLDLDRGEVLAMERIPCYRPSPLSLHRLSQFYGIPQERLIALAGATRELPVELREEASRFAAQSESFANLTKEEKKLVDDFIQVLKAQTPKGQRKHVRRTHK